MTTNGLKKWDSALCVVPYQSDTLMNYFVYEAYDLYTDAPLVSLDQTSSFDAVYQARLDTAQKFTNSWTIDSSKSSN